MSLAETDDPIRDASTVCVIESYLPANQLADYQQLLIDMPSGGQKVATTCDQVVDARQIPLEMAKLLLDGLAYLVDTGSLFFATARNCRLACLRCVRGLWPKLSLT
jgi:hypothetical protein